VWSGVKRVVVATGCRKERPRSRNQSIDLQFTAERHRGGGRRGESVTRFREELYFSLNVTASTSMRLFVPHPTPSKASHLKGSAVQHAVQPLDKGKGCTTDTSCVKRKGHGAVAARDKVQPDERATRFPRRTTAAPSLPPPPRASSPPLAHTGARLRAWPDSICSE
jgi:hypothetical protein